MQPIQPEKGLPLIPIDSSKRYDVYVWHHMGEERVFENVRLLAFRRLDEPYLGTFLEVETINGRRMMIAVHQIHAMCEQGTNLAYRVVPRQSDNNPTNPTSD
jgi:hypothetical protein